MDFSFSDEQDAIRASVAEVLAREAGPAAYRRAVEGDGALDRRLWDTIAELGWAGVAIDPVYGGAGLGLVELAIVQEEAGRHLLAAPFFSTACLAVPVVAAAGDCAVRDEVLRSIATEATIATLAVTERDGAWSPRAIRARATPRGDTWVLSGRKAYVPDAHVADQLIVAARTGAVGAVTLFVVPAAALPRRPRPRSGLDGGRRLCEVSLSGVVVGADRILGPIDGGWSILDKALDRAAAALAAEGAGVAGRATELAVEYAKARTQFGRPIGAFQAVSHRCADMYLATENARATAYYAAWALDVGAPDAPLAVATAKVAGATACQVATSGAIQVHGGIGFTWEHDAHLYLRRGKFVELFLGSAGYWRDQVVERRLAVAP